MKPHWLFIITTYLQIIKYYDNIYTLNINISEHKFGKIASMQLVNTSLI